MPKRGKGKDTLFEAGFDDSLYGGRMLLSKDGRRRGLWVWIEEDAELRAKVDRKVFDAGVAALVPDLARIFSKKDREMLGFEVRQALRKHLDFFLGHRTEGAAVRLTWAQVRELADSLRAGDAKEKKKTEDREEQEVSDE